MHRCSVIFRIFYPILYLASSYVVLLSATSNVSIFVQRKSNLGRVWCGMVRIEPRFYNRTTRPTRLDTNGESSSSVLLFALPFLCALSSSVRFTKEGLISR